jgi:hypothetical protein
VVVVPYFVEVTGSIPPRVIEKSRLYKDDVIIGRSSDMIIVRARTSFNRATILIGKRTMSTKTIAVLDHGDLKDGQM